MHDWIILMVGWIHVGYGQKLTVNKTEADVPFNAHVYERGQAVYPPRTFFYKTQLHISGEVTLNQRTSLLCLEPIWTTCFFIFCQIWIKPIILYLDWRKVAYEYFWKYWVLWHHKDLLWLNIDYNKDLWWLNFYEFLGPPLHKNVFP